MPQCRKSPGDRVLNRRNPAASLGVAMVLCLVTNAGCDTRAPDRSPASSANPAEAHTSPDSTASAPPSTPIVSPSRTEDPGGSRSDTEPSTPTPERTPRSADAVPGDQTASASPSVGRFRLPADRGEPDLAQLAAHGIRAYESRHLLLLSDVQGEHARDLPALADELFSALEKSLGSLAPAADNTPFRAIGCLIDAPERFTAAGLMPAENFRIRHGRHLNYHFWMFNPPSDYYRRHLLLHEFVHCFMNCEYGMFDIPPLWYTEGIAEYFATHLPPTPDGRPAKFGVLPSDIDQFHGWGRIAEVRRSFQNPPDPVVTDAGFTPLHLVIDPLSPVYDTDRQYAHAWALYWLLQNHPEYRNVADRFAMVRSSRDYVARFDEIPPETQKRLAIEWPLFLDSLIEAFDSERAFPIRRTFDTRPAPAGDPAPDPSGLPGDDHAESDTRTVLTGSVLTGSVTADRGWQSPGRMFNTGQIVEVTATGRFTMGQVPRPWISEPSGITIRYHRGRPLGELVVMLVAADGSRASRRIPVGRRIRLQIPWDGELWLQLNDSAASRSDNSGEALVTIRFSDDN